MFSKTPSKTVDCPPPEWGKNYSFGPRDGFGYEVRKTRTQKSYQHQNKTSHGLDVGVAIGTTLFISNVMF